MSVQEQQVSEDWEMSVDCDMSQLDLVEGTKFIWTPNLLRICGSGRREFCLTVQNL